MCVLKCVFVSYKISLANPIALLITLCNPCGLYFWLCEVLCCFGNIESTPDRTDRWNCWPGTTRICVV